MASFRDKDGRDWDLSVNVFTAKQVKSRLGVDILDLGEGGFLEKMGDIQLVVDILWVLCQEQAARYTVDDPRDGGARRPFGEEDFARMLLGDTVEAAVDAFVEALVSFYPSPRQAVLRKALAKGREVDQAALQQAEELLDAINVEDLSRAIGSRPAENAHTPTMTTAKRPGSGDGSTDEASPAGSISGESVTR